MPPRLMTKYHPPEGPLRVLHRDDQVLAVSKPSGLLSVPGKPAAHGDCLERRVKAAYPEALLIHRLDLETSGVMVFALNRRAQRLINGQFERRIVEKTYLARVSGRVSGETGRIDLPLCADWPNRPLQKVCWQTGKTAVTHWRVLDREAGSAPGGGPVTRLMLCPETGRSHQLRVHLCEIGHPILGDPFYGDPFAAPRLQLHAAVLRLRHPADGAWISFEDPSPF